MYKKLVSALLLVVFFSQVAIPAAFAAGGPAGGCAPGFTLEMAMDHEIHHHKHVGIVADLNGDGYICMKTVTPSARIHLHVDNTVR